MSPIRWHRRRSSENADLTCYNLRDQLVVVELEAAEASVTSEKGVGAGAARCKDTSREKRNPLLEKVKNTRLSCFRAEDRHSLLGDAVVGNSAEGVGVGTVGERETGSGDNVHRRVASKSNENVSYLDNSGTHIGSPGTIAPGARSKTKVSGSPSCLSAKLRAMSERYLRCSTSRFITKLYRNNKNPAGTFGQSQKAKLRSFSYGALPGVEEFQKRHNPLYREEEDESYLMEDGHGGRRSEDCDSGILMNGSTNSSLIEFSRSCRVGTHGRSISLDQTAYPADDPPAVPQRHNTTKTQRLKPFPVSPPAKDVKLVRLARCHPGEELGIFIAKKRMTSEGSHGYVIAQMATNGLADRCIQLDCVQTDH